MRTHRTTSFLLSGTVFAIVVLNASSAFACGVCTTAVMDRFFPPIELWIGLSIGWFFINEVIFVLRGERTLGAFILMLLLIGGLLLAGLLLLGPLGLFGLLIVALAQTLSAVVPSFYQGWTPHSVRDIRIVGALGLLALVALSGYSVVVRHTRSEAVYILKWGHTGPGRVAITRLVQRGTEAFPELRILAQQGTDAHVGRVVDAIREHGTVPDGVPVLIDMLDTARRRQLGAEVIVAIEETLRIVSTVDLPNGTSSETWRDTWEQSETPP